MLLSFKNGQFILSSVERSTYIPNEWQSLSESVYVTDNFKAALRFKESADERAVKVLNRAFVKAYTLPPESLPLFLDSHQFSGVRWILTRSRSYLAHAPGAGKTLEAITASMYTDETGQTVFIVPPDLVQNWDREITNFAPRISQHLEKGFPFFTIATVGRTAQKDKMNWGADFIIVPDSMLTAPWVIEGLSKIKKKFVAVDEASRFKEATAQRTIALFGGKFKDGTRSPGLVYDSKHSVLMDGSPLLNRPMELWAPTFAMCPEAIEFMSEQDFGFKYCGAKINDRGHWEFKHSAREHELKKKLQDKFMHVVTEEELDHPERRRSMLLMTEDARSPAHKAWERKNLHRINFSDVSEAMNRGEIATFRKELGLNKVEWSAEYVRGRLKEKNESIIVYAWHREVVFQLEKALSDFRPITILGGVEADYRESMFANFQRGISKLIIGNIAAMARGHNLQRADRVIFVEWAWNDETNKQAEKRAARKGRSRDLPVRSDYIVCPNSMDEPLLHNVFRSAERVKRVIG